VHDADVAVVVETLKKSSRGELFKFDHHGRLCDVKDRHVNEYIQSIIGRDFTAKDFRTWAGTVLCSLTLQEFDACASETEAKKNVVAAVKRVSERLGNTPAVCRKAYIHPVVLDAYLDGSLLQALRDLAEQEFTASPPGLDPAEAQLLALLQQKARSVP
jgi:DNA topoisomerase-1